MTGGVIPARFEGEKIIGVDGRILGRWLDAMLVGEGPDLGIDERTVGEGGAGDVVACWSGAPGATSDDPFPDDPGAWTPGAWSALEHAVERLAPALGARNMVLLIRPHHRHVVGDVPSVGRLVRVLREKGIDRVGIALDVESMLAPSMRKKNPDDHRRRIREALGSIARIEIV